MSSGLALRASRAFVAQAHTLMGALSSAAEARLNPISGNDSLYSTEATQPSDDKDSTKEKEETESSTSSKAPEPVVGQPDPFTAQLQAKTEAELFELLQRNRTRFEGREAQLAASSEEEEEEALGSEGEDEEEEEEEEALVNAVTGERLGPKGREPTRFGDWEIKGRCSDF